MIDYAALGVFGTLLALAAIVGFLASRRRLNDLHEWGLGGGRFGTLITWFLLGGDLYTAYTFIAVPALVYGSGAMGFFALPYTIMVYPLAFAVLPRLWAICRENGYVTLADYAYGRHQSKSLEFAIAFTGLLAVTPYIALQLLGIRVVIAAMGVSGVGYMKDAPMIAAFLLLAAYTYKSGLRAPAMIAIIKDILIFITIGAALIVIPAKFGGFAHIFTVAQSVLAARAKPGSVIVAPGAFSAYVTLALGSAMTLFLYPHTITGVLGAKSANVIRRNAALLPAYSVALAFIAMLGYMAIAAGVKPSSPNDAVPLLFKAAFPSWFAGVAFAAIAIGALVPAAIMAVAAANLAARNLYTRYLCPAADGADQTRIAKRFSLLVILGALLFVMTVPLQYAVDMQLLGGVWILQTLPTILTGLHIGTQCRKRALLSGWLAGMIVGSVLVAAQHFTLTTLLHAGDLAFGCYTAIVALAINLAVMSFFLFVQGRLHALV